jgi:hypothetical protein
MQRLSTQGAYHPEVSTVAIHAGSVQLSATDRFTRLTRLQELVDKGAVYVPQSLTVTQFSTLRVLLGRLYPQHAQLAACLDAELASDPEESFSYPVTPLRLFDYQLGLDEMDSLARTRTGFAFADLTIELQDAMLGLIATRDLTTRRLDLSLWLKQLKNSAAGLQCD